MKKRYLCPKHTESTGSAVAYATGYHCFGCGARGPLADLNLPAGIRPEISYVEDLEKSIERIKHLPQKQIRGFSLNCNDKGYYLLWPNSDYYKFRSYSPENPGGKYRGPSGHVKPWYWVDSSHPTLVVVEGEFNALSLAALKLPLSIVSPGGAGDFYSRTAERELRGLCKFGTIFLVVDDDAAGAIAGIEASSKLKAMGANCVHIKLVKKDFNDVFTEQGKETLEGDVSKLGLLRGM